MDSEHCSWCVKSAARPLKRRKANDIDQFLASAQIAYIRVHAFSGNTKSLGIFWFGRSFPFLGFWTLRDTFYTVL